MIVGIPAYERSEMLRRAISSVLAQTVPTTALVCVQGDNSDVKEVVDSYAGNPNVVVHKSKATDLWSNWQEAFRAAMGLGGEFFAWLQDDDIVATHFAKRVIGCMTGFTNPSPALYMGRLGVSHDGTLGRHWEQCGPTVPMDLLTGRPITINSELVAVGAWFTSWTLSPALAFPLNDNSLKAVEACPGTCNLYVERLILAELARFGPAVCDPAIVGYWIMHEGNTSRKLNQAGGAQSEWSAFADHLSEKLSLIPDRGWRAPLSGWARLVGRENVTKWVQDTKTHYKKGWPLLDEARELVAALHQITIEDTCEPSDSLSKPVTVTGSSRPAKSPSSKTPKPKPSSPKGSRRSTGKSAAFPRAHV